MNPTLLKKLKGDLSFRDIAVGFHWFTEDNGYEPETLRDLRVYLEATNADQRQIYACHRLVVQYEPVSAAPLARARDG